MNDLKVPGFFKAWFVFVALMSVGSFAFAIWVIVKVLEHFGVI